MAYNYFVKLNIVNILNFQATSNIFAAADRVQPINVEEKEFSFGEFTNRLSTLVARVDQKEAEKERSLLPPLSGTVAERQAKYNEKSKFEY